MTMFSAERRAQLMKLLSKSGYVPVSELAKELEVSPVTIRRDLLVMEKEGICIRKRGGAISRSQGVTMELPYIIKHVQNTEAKKRIAEAALEQIEDGASIILDSGSTTYELALLLAAKRRLSVVTNDLQIAAKLAANSGINLICTGGVARPNVFSLQGTMAETCFKNLSVDIAFLGADAIHADGGIYNANIEETPVKQAMLKAAARIIVLADSTKFQMRGFCRVCDLSQVDIVITDNKITPETKDMIRETFNKELVVV